MCFPFPDRLICCFCTDSSSSSSSTFAGAALAIATIPVMLVNLAILGNLQNQPSSPPTSNSTAECCQELLWCNWCMHMYVFIIWQLRLWVIWMILVNLTGCSVEVAAHCQELLLRQNLSRFFSWICANISKRALTTGTSCSDACTQRSLWFCLLEMWQKRGKCYRWIKSEISQESFLSLLPQFPILLTKLQLAPCIVPISNICCIVPK